MQISDREVVILKPTPYFLSFLQSQLPSDLVPSLEKLQIDATAYTIKKFDDEESTLQEIEKHFSHMFSHEIKRWLGEQATHPIEKNFLDFLCCFKFEMHAHMLLIESHIDNVCQLLCVEPRSVMLKWLKNEAQVYDDAIALLDHVNLNHLVENSTVVLKNFNQLSEIQAIIKTFHPYIVESEMLRMCSNHPKWPIIKNVAMFTHYFKVNIHTQLIHLY